jgi:hypothetical protein
MLNVEFQLTPEQATALLQLLHRVAGETQEEINATDKCRAALYEALQEDTKS